VAAAEDDVSELDYTDELVELVLERHRAAVRADERAVALLGKAVMLAPSLDVCEALLRGEDVPRDRLDRVWRRRYAA
jgi:hypothetical protein